MVTRTMDHGGLLRRLLSPVAVLGLVPVAAVVVTVALVGGVAVPAAGSASAATGGSTDRTTAAATTAPPAVVPYQFVAKAYTELLGRAPTPAEWAAAVGYFTKAGCSVGSLRRFGNRVVGSAEYRSDYPPGAATAGAIVLSLYRFVLNREPDPTGYVENRDLIAAGAITPPRAAENLFGTAEFADLTEPAICSPTNPNYYFGQPGNWTGFPAMQTPEHGTPGPDDTEAALQLQLDSRSAAGGGPVVLPAREVVGLTTTLVVPGNVTLTTAGDPDPDRYADMARLVRLDGFGPLPDYSGEELVRLQPGAKLEHVWVDGQRDAPDPSSFLEFDVRMLGGRGTTVKDDRIGSPYGASNVEDDSTESNVPGATACTDNVVSDNLVDGYGSTHEVAAGSSDHPEADALGIYCQDATVRDNDIVDVSDTAVALFDGASSLATTRPQRSRVMDNTVVSAGNSYSFGIVTDPSYSLHQGATPGGDPSGTTSRSFAGTVISGNRFWTGTRTHINVVLSAGTHDLFGSTVHQNCALPNQTDVATCGGGRNALGATWTDNSSGGQLLEAEIGIYVGGSVDTTFRDNDLSKLVEVSGGFCPHFPVVLATGFATGVRLTRRSRATTVHQDVDQAADSCVNPAF